MIPLSVTSSEEFKVQLCESLSLKYALRNTVKEIVSGVGELRRISNCGNLSGQAVPVLSFGIDGNPFFVTDNCESASCPYCATRLGAERLHDLEDAINSFHIRFPFGCVAMMVLTFSHRIDAALSDIGTRFRDAKQMFFRECKVKKILRSLGCIGRVTAPETTWSNLNGFHPHEHILFFFESASDSDILSARQQLFPYWEKVCCRVGFRTVFDRFYFEKQISKHLKDYVTKCAREVTLSDCKKGFSASSGVTHYSPFQLVSAFMETKNSVFSEKFTEYALYSKGLKSYNWSKGLAETLSVKHFSPEFKVKRKEFMKDSINVFFSGNDFPDFQKVKFIAESVGSDQKERFIRFMMYLSSSAFRDRVKLIQIHGKQFEFSDFLKRIQGREAIL